MVKLKLARPMLVALAACAASVAFNSVVFADDAQTQALKDQMRIMQQQMQQLQQQIDAMSTKQAAGPPASAASNPGKGPRCDDAPGNEDSITSSRVFMAHSMCPWITPPRAWRG